MSNANAMMLLIVILVSYLTQGAIILAAAHQLDRQRQQDQQERATMQRQLSVIQRSVGDLEGMARAVRGDVVEEEAADLFVER